MNMNEQEAGVAMENARKYMLRHGWAPGKGLGKNEQGRAVHLRVSKKTDNKGIGGTAKEKYTPWWERMYNSTAQALAQRAASASPAPEDGAQPPAKKARKEKTKAERKKKSKAAKDSSSSSSDSSSSSSSDSDTDVEAEAKALEPIDEVVLRRPKAVRLYGTPLAPRFVKGDTLVATMPGAEGDKPCEPEQPKKKEPAADKGFVPVLAESSSSDSDSSDSEDEDEGKPVSTSDATFAKLGGSRCKKYSSEAKLRRLAAQEAAWKRKKLASATPSPEPK